MPSQGVKIGSKQSIAPRRPSHSDRGKGTDVPDSNRDPMAKYDRDPVFKSSSIQQDYEIKWHKNLGSGISGPVRLCINKETGEEYALKILLDRPKARKEVTLHWLCSGSEYVVRVIDVYANEVLLPGDSVPKKRILMVMELMRGGELFEYITRKQNFTEREASMILRQITSAVQYCHRLSIAHRDLKPENLLLLRKAETVDEVQIKLADFGFAKIDNGDLTTPQFTPYYVAPQVLEAQRRQREIRAGHRSPSSPYYYDKSCDMWSIGVILYIMLCGYPPFYSEIPNQPITQRMKKRIMSGDFDFPENEWRHTTDAAKDVVRKLLCVEPSERITIDQLLRHRWLESNSVPSRDLPSPGIMLNQEALEQTRAVHSEFLQDMRRKDDGFFLKPVGKSQNKLLTNRQQRRSPGPSDGAGPGERRESLNPERELQANLDSLQSLKELKDICVMPPPLPSGTGVSYADSTLIEGVKKVLIYNDGHVGLLNVFRVETWNGKEFTGMVNRQRLAESIQAIIDSLPKVDITTA